jgi:iron complex outermembrane receptor protein
MLRAVAVAFLIVCIAQVPAVHAGNIAGRVVDGRDGAPLAGVEVRPVGVAAAVLSGADGSFTLMGLPAGAVTLSFFRVGYEPAKRSAVAPEDPAAASQLAVVALQPVEFREEPIVVNATRAERRTNPVPYTNLTHQDLDERYTTQDVPVLLSETPSAIYSSDSGNGIGYTYLTLRGFDSRRVSVMVNGIPQNDPEDHNVYWIDFPELSANLQDLQVQRGAGSAFYGPPAIGGAVNLVTTLFQPKPGLRLLAGGGTFGTRKYSVEGNSGLVNGTYAFYGRYSRLLSDGYRIDSWVNLTSYFLGAVRYDEQMTTRIHVYGGPVSDGLAYYGVPGDALHDRDARRQNVLAGGSQVENFSQPHYELLHEWRLSSTRKLSNSLFFVQGDGFFDYDGSWADTTYYRLTSQFGFHPTGNPGQSLIHAFVSNKQGGWLPRFDWQHARGTLAVGAELRHHRSEHWGQIRWAENLPPELDPARRYYSYHGGKDIASVYGNEVYALRDDLKATGSLQLIWQRYRIFDEAFVGNDFEQPYWFANPRFGLNYNATPALHGYASYGYVQREPRLNILYNAAESSGGAVPQYAERADGSFDFDAPQVHPEKLHDWEVGGGWRTERWGADVSLFWMDFRDEIVKTGEVDNFGQPITVNAASSVHRGVELALHAQPWKVLELGGNLSWSRNQFRDFVESGVQRGGNSIAGFPDFVANLRGTVRDRGAMAALAGRYVGPLFTNNREEPDAKVTPYFVLDGDLAYEFHAGPLQPTRLHLQVRNLLDRLYVLGGEDAAFFPAATRNAFASVEVGF